ncbi:MAG TPA: glycine--tRNA ligase subunit beta [Candidatus Acidoferrum sp.]|nr:glycine--tRNA ligase subunit beta [Candidatus Acidoferrum sp.]
MSDFLLEIGCEEIPARMIDAAQADLASRLGQLLARELLGSPEEVTSFSTPRRLSVMATVAPAQADVTEQVTGPPVSAAFKDGQPAQAAQAFARKVGVDVSRLARVTTPKGEYLAATVTKKGRAAAEILAEALPREIAAIYWPKNMYWRKPSEKFVRPVRWLVAMLDGEVVPLEFGGIQSGRASRGHRILADEEVRIPRAGAPYVEALKQAKVLGREAREFRIREELDAATRTIPGARWREDNALLDKVVNLTEFPAVILGRFEAEFLELPEEVLVTVMRDHQNYFAIEDGNQKLLPNFLAVLNTDGDAGGMIRHGHERVLRARFNDGRFFWQTDQKHPLRERVEWLKHVTFQKELGTYHEKTLRVQRLCSWLCELVKGSGIAVRPGVVHKAACLAKADLTTELVKEFTELQGIVGGLYARVQQLDADLPEATRFAIADAIYDQYKPESMEDSIPRTVEGAVLSIGDKADSIAGMFALGLIPSGSKDPFALRRQANGIVRTIAEYKLPVPLVQLLLDARESYRGMDAEKKFSGKVDFPGAVREFFRERVEFYLREVLAFRYDVVNAVLAVGADEVVDAVARARALKEVLPKPEFQAIAAACKRTRNILRQAEEKQFEVGTRFESSSVVSEEEKSLSAFIEQSVPRVREQQKTKDYLAALLALSAAREPVDRFFDKVMVMVEDPRVRANRLALLARLQREFSTIADFSEIVTEGRT